MWPEPLTASTTVTSDTTATVRTYAGDGRAVAEAPILYNVQARYGQFGAMTILDANAGPFQRVRALVLLVREALRYAASIGLADADTDVPPYRPALLDFARRMSGDAGTPDASRRTRIGGHVYAMRSAALNASDADGNLTGDPIVNL